MSEIFVGGVSRLLPDIFAQGNVSVLKRKLGVIPGAIRMEPENLDLPGLVPHTVQTAACCSTE